LESQSKNGYKARISYYESKYQIIMSDKVRWGGKEIEEVKEFLEGRVLSVMYQIGKNRTLGLISVYGVSGEGRAKR